MIPSMRLTQQVSGISERLRILMDQKRHPQGCPDQAKFFGVAVVAMVEKGAMVGGLDRVVLAVPAVLAAQVSLVVKGGPAAEVEYSEEVDQEAREVLAEPGLAVEGRDTQEAVALVGKL